MCCLMQVPLQGCYCDRQCDGNDNVVDDENGISGYFLATLINQVSFDLRENVAPKEKPFPPNHKQLDPLENNCTPTPCCDFTGR